MSPSYNTRTILYSDKIYVQLTIKTLYVFVDFIEDHFKTQWEFSVKSVLHLNDFSFTIFLYMQDQLYPKK